MTTSNLPAPHSAGTAEYFLASTATGVVIARRAHPHTPEPWLVTTTGGFTTSTATDDEVKLLARVVADRPLLLFPTADTGAIAPTDTPAPPQVDPWQATATHLKYLFTRKVEQERPPRSTTLRVKVLSSLPGPEDSPDEIEAALHALTSRLSGDIGKAMNEDRVEVADALANAKAKITEAITKAQEQEEA